MYSLCPLSESLADCARLDNDFIVLRGDENEASSQLLKGVVVLCLPAALKVEDVHLRMVGHLKIGYESLGLHSSWLHKADSCFLQME